MANTKNYVYNDFSVQDCLYLEIDTVKYEVSQFNGSWAVNEIPLAQCLLATGRDGSSSAASVPAMVHRRSNFRQMQKAKVWFHPKAEYGTDVEWPGRAFVIFDGYFMGFAYRKVNGKIHVVAHLSHWLVDMACSSCLTKTGHVSNPAQMNTAAVLAFPNLTGPTLPAAPNAGAYTTIDTVSALVSNIVGQDVWKSIKTVFCTLAGVKTAPAGVAANCEGGPGQGSWSANDRALSALSRFETDAAGCAFDAANDNGTVPGPGGAFVEPQRYAAVLGMPGAPDVVNQTVHRAIGNATVDSYANVSFWDKLVGDFAPMFGMAVVPMVHRALVIADLPGYRGGVWKTIEHAEYDSLDQQGMLEFPLRGVGVVAEYESDTKAGVSERGGGQVILGGCFVEESVDVNDGVLQVVASPAWLRMSTSALPYTGTTSGVKTGDGSRAAGSDAPGVKGVNTPETFGVSLRSYYDAYAHTVYVNNMLRGRNGSMSGKLRFDIAPGSIVRIEQKAELFVGAEDDLACALVACVARVTVTINAESPAAATTFVLSHIRRENPENGEEHGDRTSVTQHPLFATGIHGGGRHGAPLIPALDL